MEKAILKDLVEKIKSADRWDMVTEEMAELCAAVGLDDEWKSADGDTFEAVIDLALERAKAGMEKIEMPIEIKFAIYDHEWTGFILSEESLVPATDCTDDDWNLLPEYEGYVWIDTETWEEPKIVKYDDILFECEETARFRSGWGYVCPEVGPYALNCVSSPNYVADDNGKKRYFV